MGGGIAGAVTSGMGARVAARGVPAGAGARRQVLGGGLVAAPVGAGRFVGVGSRGRVPWGVTGAPGGARGGACAVFASGGAKAVRGAVRWRAVAEPAEALLENEENEEEDAGAAAGPKMIFSSTCTVAEEDGRKCVLHVAVTDTEPSSEDSGEFVADLVLEGAELVAGSNVGNVRLHWSQNSFAAAPPQALWPPGTQQVDDLAVQTPFEAGADGSGKLTIRVPKAGRTAMNLDSVLRATPEFGPEKWYNNGGANYGVNLDKPTTRKMLDEACKAEREDDYFGVFRRMKTAARFQQEAANVGGDSAAIVYAWMRLSNMRVLNWNGGGGQQSKDFDWATKDLAEKTAWLARAGPEPMVRQFARMTLPLLSRGGGDAEQIRMGILHIMRDHGIKEGHRPGIDDKFIEQWHQKLHQNTNALDIKICEALLHYYHVGGDGGEFWRHLYEHGGLTKEFLAGMDNPITHTPFHLPQMINSFKHYLWVLKTVHAGADLGTMLTMCDGKLDNEVKGILWDIQNNREEWWVGGRIVEARERLAGYVSSGTGGRDVALLDASLDSFLRICVERGGYDALDGNALIELAALVLRNAAISADDDDLRDMRDLWGRVQGMDREAIFRDATAAQQALAACERVQLSLQHYTGRIHAMVQPVAEAIGTAGGVDPAYLVNFGEEAVRGHAVFPLGPVLDRFARKVRQAAGISPWQVACQGPPEGARGVLLATKLADEQGRTFDRPTVIFNAGPLTGMEDIPAGVVGVVCGPSTLDTLSHVAIRARSEGVLLAATTDESELADLQALAVAGGPVVVTVAPGGAVRAAADQAPAVSNASKASAGATKVSLDAVKETTKWTLQESEFAEGLVGGKSLNLARLRKAVPAGVEVPASVTLPFGVFERVLADPANAKTSAALSKALGAASTAKDEASALQHLAEARKAVTTKGALACPTELRAELEAALGALSPASGPKTKFPRAWKAICAVWASKWTDRAWLSRRRAGVDEDALKMAVLLQAVQPAGHAFVLHTANPVLATSASGGAAEEVVGELVVGLGETLVSGAVPGRSLAFTAPRDGTAGLGPASVTALPSKPSALASAGGLIARSDSNGEDLERFAGAGLYDSVPVAAFHEERVTYNGGETTLAKLAESLVWDSASRADLVARLVKAGVDVEVALASGAQDIEGCVLPDGTLVVVQARPQVE